MVDGMSVKPRAMNKGDMVSNLRERGLSRRDAVRILDCVLDEMAAALRRGEAVEFALGSLKRMRHAHKQQQGRFLGKIRTIYKRPYSVVLEVSSEGEKLLQRTTRRQDPLAELWRRRPARASNRIGN